jgi:hypothetical protein
MVHVASPNAPRVPSPGLEGVCIATGACDPLATSQHNGSYPRSRRQAEASPQTAGKGWRHDHRRAAPIGDEQAIIVFLRQLDHALSDALRGDEQRRQRWLTVIQALVMAVLADPRHLDQALRQAADGLAQLNP